MLGYNPYQQAYCDEALFGLSGLTVVVGAIVAVGCFRVVLPSEFNGGGTAKGTVDETAPLQEVY